ncbi:RNA polymerase sigma factor [Fonticella tunisiensis]|uniref:RNA polymerase sigma-70 factor (ECF subfamily) n=1 Tax=Fonticella tunisiensis TaxID=1096341 RepID=A0A4R7KTM0_9CLOT|nr:RNA polymerase sigma factor [Fonticella tunisiensis]TDT62783.1 RNA polymerase sigma-70 factor (ECF subfamily) [Fonticella tunisiensis]
MEKNILLKIQQGDKNAFAKLYDEYSESALRTAMAITKDKMYAADAVQETFIRVYKNIGEFDINRTFEPWFYRILINECNRILSRNSKTIPMDDFIESGLPGCDEDRYRFEEYESLYKAIEKLDDINRIPIVLKYLKGFSEGEIAQILEINLNTVKSRLFKGRQKLRRYIELLEGGSEHHG